MSSVEQRAEARESGGELGNSIKSGEPLKPKPLSGARGLIALIVAIGGGLILHLVVGKNEPLKNETALYTQFLSWALGITLLAGIVQNYWPALRRWMRESGPIFALGFVVLAIGEAITTGMGL